MLDSAIAHEIAAGHVTPDYRHAIAYAAEEVHRAERDSSYTTNARTPWYPLIDAHWDGVRWDRDQCDRYLFNIYGLHWPRSCCVFRFQAPLSGREALAARWAREPEAGAHALLLERRAIAANRKMRLFGGYAAADLVRDHNLTTVAELADAEVAATDTWSVIETRRVYRPASVKHPETGKSIRGRDGRTVKDRTRKGDAWRSLRTCAVANIKAAARLMLERIAEEYDTAVWTGTDRVSRVGVRVLPPMFRMARHHLRVRTRARPSATQATRRFDAEWDRARDREDLRGGGLTPLALAM